jgi:branched-chain amino acid transport system substrate-binding protein
VIIQDIAKTSVKARSLDNLKGKHIALIYHDSPFGKEAYSSFCKSAHAMHGFKLSCK